MISFQVLKLSMTPTVSIPETHSIHSISKDLEELIASEIVRQQGLDIAYLTRQNSELRSKVTWQQSTIAQLEKELKQTVTAGRDSVLLLVRSCFLIWAYSFF